MGRIYTIILLFMLFNTSHLGQLSNFDTIILLLTLFHISCSPQLL